MILPAWSMETAIFCHLDGGVDRNMQDILERTIYYVESVFLLMLPLW